MPVAHELRTPVETREIPPLRTIWKFGLDLAQHSIIAMPSGAVPLTVGVQGDFVVLWAEVDPSRELVPRHVFVVGTGQYLPQDKQYVGTIQMGSYVWHIYLEDES